jgi:hypothetical protein
MSDTTHEGAAAGNGSGGTEELRAEIERTRARLGGTVEALAAKADVTSRAREKAVFLKDRVRSSTPEPLRQKAVRATALARRNRTPVLAAGVGALVASAFAVRRARAHGH